MYIDQLVEPQRLPVLHKAFDDRVVETFLAHLRIWMPKVAQILDPRFFHVQQVATVVDDAHRVGLGEPDPDAMVKGIRRRDQRRLD